MAAIAYPAGPGRTYRPVARPGRIDAPAPARRRPSARVLRRRRQLAAAVIALVFAAGAVWALGGVTGSLGSSPLAAPGAGPSALTPVAAEVYVVQPGDTVWSIARSVQPTGEIRPLVDRLEHELHGQPLQVGDRLALN